MSGPVRPARKAAAASPTPPERPRGEEPAPAAPADRFEIGGSGIKVREFHEGEPSRATMKSGAERTRKLGVVEAEPGVSSIDLQSMPLWQHLLPLQRQQLRVLLDSSVKVWRLARFGLANLLEKPSFADASPQEQAKQVMATLSVDPVLPGNVAIALAGLRSEATRFELLPPMIERGFAFRGAAVDADKFGVSIGASVTPIFQPRDLVFSKPFQHTPDELANAFAMLPVQSRQLLSTIRLSPTNDPDEGHWAEKYQKRAFSTYMSVDEQGTVDVYPTLSASNVKYLKHNLLHEAGHVWSIRVWGRDETAPAWAPWRDAMKADGLPVSLYGEESPLEDVAEATALFLGTRGTPLFAEFRQLYPHRFKILTEQFGEEGVEHQ